MLINLNQSAFASNPPPHTQNSEQKYRFREPRRVLQLTSSLRPLHEGGQLLSSLADIEQESPLKIPGTLANVGSQELVLGLRHSGLPRLDLQHVPAQPSRPCVFDRTGGNKLVSEEHIHPAVIR